MGLDGRNMRVTFSGGNALKQTGYIISTHAGDEGQILHSKALPRSTLVYACNG